MYLPKSQFKEDSSKDTAISDKAGNLLQKATTILTSFGTALSVPSAADLASGNFSKSEEYVVVGPKLEDLLNYGDLQNKKDKTYYPQPTEKDYLTGLLNRYFVQDKRDQKILEVSKEGFEQAKERKVFKRIALKWVIKGPAEDQTIGKYIYPGAEAQNKNIVEQAEQHIKGLSKYIKDYKQFVK